ncbi:MAG: hypothetical protein NXI20_21135 [bacterium]|nr:hypothetical protein [bacterium]
MEFAVTLIMLGLASLYVNWVDNKDKIEILKNGTRRDGLVKRRFMKGFKMGRNHTNYRRTAIVEYKDDNGDVLERELTLDRRFYTPPASGKYIQLISYAGSIYDIKMLNRKLEIYLSFIPIIFGMVIILKQLLG